MDTMQRLEILTPSMLRLLWVSSSKLPASGTENVERTMLKDHMPRPREESPFPVSRALAKPEESLHTGIPALAVQANQRYFCALAATGHLSPAHFPADHSA